MATQTTGEQLPSNPLLEALESIRQYANDTLSGRVDGPDDREWQRACVIECRNRARDAIARATVEPSARFTGAPLDACENCGQYIDKHSCSVSPPKVKCTGCNDRGEVGGLTRDGYDGEPCPFCTTQPPSDRQLLERLEGALDSPDFSPRLAREQIRKHFAGVVKEREEADAKRIAERRANGSNEIACDEIIAHLDSTTVTKGIAP